MATIKKSTLLAALKVCERTAEEIVTYGRPYDLMGCNTQDLTGEEQLEEIKQAIEIIEALEDNEYKLIDINIVRTMLED